MSKIKRFFAVATSLTVIAMMAAPAPAGALTAAELQVQIDALLAQLAALQSQLTQLEGTGTGTGTVPAVCAGITFDRALKQGMSGSDVKCLQALLNTSADTQLASSGAGSPGNETTYFGPITKAGVVKFQEKYASETLAPWGLTSGTGYVGSTTRAKLNEVLSSGTGTGPGTGPGPGTGTVTPPTTGVKVSLASDTPGAGPVAKGAFNIQMAKINFTAGNDAAYTISKIVLKRDGMSADADIDSIKLYEGSTQIGSTQALNSTTHKVSFQNLNWQIPAGATKTLIVKANFATSSTVGNSISFGIDSVSDVVVSGGATVVGPPVYGNTRTVAGISVGRLDVDVLATPAASDVISGSTEQHLASIKFTASATEGFDVNSLKLTEVGTSASGDIKNLKLKYVGEQLGSTIADLTASETATFEGAPLFSVKAGTSKTIDVYADITADVRSERTVILEIDEAFDVTAIGQNTGGGVTITGASGAVWAVDAGATFTVKQGTLTIAWDAATNPSATYYTVGTEQNVIASFKFSASSREGIKITKLKLNEGGTIADTEFQNVQIYIDGATASTGHIGSVSSATVTFQDADGLFTVPKGGNTVVTVKADISSSATNARTIKFHIGALTNIEMKGVDSNAKIDADASHITYSAVDTSAEATAHTVKSYGNLTISNAPDTPAGTNLTLGQSNVEILRFRLAAEYEAMSVASIKVRLYNDSSLSDADTDTASTGTTYLQNIKLYDGSTLLKEVASPSAGYVNFSVNLTVAKDQTKTLRVVADVPSTSNLTYLAGAVGAYNGNNGQITVADELITTGVNSSQDIVETGGAYGNSFTLRTPSLAVVAAPYPPASNPYIVSNTTGAQIARLILTCSYEDIKVNQVTITFDDSATLQGFSQAQSIFKNIKLKVGSTQIGTTKQITDGGTTGTVTAQRDRVIFDSINNLTLLKDQQIYLDVYADVTATSTYTNTLSWYVGHASGSDIIGSGLYSNTAVTSTGASTVGNAIVTLAGGTLTISVDAETPTTANLAVGAAGATGVTFAKLKFEADYEDMLVKTLKFSLIDAAAGATSTAGAYDFDKVYLYDGSTLLAQSVLDPTYTTSTALFTNDAGLFTVVNGVAKVITLKADTKGIGTGVLSGDSPKFHIINLQNTNLVQSRGVSSNASTSATDGTPNPETIGNLNSIYLYKTTVIVAPNASMPSGTQTAAPNKEVFRFDVTADSKGDAVLNSLALKVAGSGVLSTGGTGNANLYKVGSATPLATETYKAVTITKDVSSILASTTAATSTIGDFDGIPVGATVHIRDTSLSAWYTAKVIGIDTDYMGLWSRIRFETAITFGATTSDVIHYQPLQPGEGKLYFGGMTFLKADVVPSRLWIKVDDASGFAPGDTVKIWGYGSGGTLTSESGLIVATTTLDTIWFATAPTIAVDYNFNVGTTTDAAVSRAIIYTTDAANNIEEAISAGTSKTFYITGDTTGAAATAGNTISLSMDSAADFVWSDGSSWTSGIQKIINARTKTFPLSTSLSY